MLKVPVSPDPVFVGSAYLRESLPAGNPEGDDDKVYFFFSETGKEFDYFENTIVSRIARVCKVGTGQRGCARGVTIGMCGDVGPPCTSPSSGSWTPRRGPAPMGDPSWQLRLQITQPKAEARACCSHQHLWCQWPFSISSAPSLAGTQDPSSSRVVFPFPWVHWSLPTCASLTPGLLCWGLGTAACMDGQTDPALLSQPMGVPLMGGTAP